MPDDFRIVAYILLVAGFVGLAILIAFGVRLLEREAERRVFGPRRRTQRRNRRG